MNKKAGSISHFRYRLGADDDRLNDTGRVDSTRWNVVKFDDWVDGWTKSRRRSADGALDVDEESEGDPAQPEVMHCRRRRRFFCHMLQQRNKKYCPTSIGRRQWRPVASVPEAVIKRTPDG